jgi:hypothetical protein
VIVAVIDILKDTEHQLTILTVKGKVTGEEIVQMIKTHNRRQITKNILWDLTDASYPGAKSLDIDSFVGATQEFMIPRQGGKTAIVASTDLGYGLSRMFEILQSVSQSHVEHGTFRTRESALQWLNL